MTGLDPAYAWLEEQAAAYAVLLADQPRTAPPVPPHLVHPGAQPRPTVSDLTAFAQELRDVQAVTP